MTSYPGVYVEEISSGVTPIQGVATSTTAFVGSARSGPIDEPSPIASFADFDRVFGGLWLPSSLGFAVRDFFLNGGGNAIVVRVNRADTISTADFIGEGMEAASQGLFALNKVDLFNLLCIPPYNQHRNVDSSVLAAAAKLCEEHRAFLLIDSPSEWTSADLAKRGVANLGVNSKNAAVFYPRLRLSNPLRNNQSEDFSAAAAVAGVYARNDWLRGVWKAPAGPEATLAGLPAVSLTPADAADLYRLGINCLRRFPKVGTVIWGLRTLEGANTMASEWKYVPVRRLALFIEESIYRGTQWTVFEPNDEPLWASIRLRVGAFLHQLFLQGALLGWAPHEAYFVRCDRTTMNQADIDGGIVNVLIGFAPLRPAEFVIIRIQLRAGDR